MIRRTTEAQLRLPKTTLSRSPSTITSTELSFDGRSFGVVPSNDQATPKRARKASRSAQAVFDRAPWWTKAVTYQVLVRSFHDSNGDGIGDLEGVRRKLDYLEWLGVDTIWLNPFLASPQQDDGYDVSDYFSVFPEYGNVECIERLIEEAHARGLRVIMDVALNHTSDQHPWFQRAIHSPKGSPFRDWYVWSDTDDKYPDAPIIFPDAEKSNWTWHPDADQFYWHRFFSHQPDLNFDNEEVQRAICNVFGHWVEKGVDGFRLDAVGYLFEREGTNCANLEETHDFIKRLRRFIDEKSSDRPIALLAEVNQPRDELVKYFGDGDECHMAYDFNLMPEIYAAFASGSARGFAGRSEGLIKVLSDRDRLPEHCVLPAFLRNHDELTLERVSDDVREAIYAHFAQDPRARRNVGIGRRLAPLLKDDPERLRLAHTLLLSLDSPVMYYGDEIGMGDDLDLPDRHPVRTAMQWEDKTPNVADQLEDKGSLLHYVRRLLKIRRSHPELALGRLEVIDPKNEDVLAFTRKLGKKTTLCLYNFADRSQSVTLDPKSIGGQSLRDLLAPEMLHASKDGTIALDIPARRGAWLGVGRRRMS